MKKIEIKLTGVHNTLNPVVIVDNQMINFKKNKQGNLVYLFETEKDTIKIKANRFLDVGGIAWFFIQILFFLISFLGLFDVHQKESCMGIDFEMIVDLKEENKISLQFMPQKENKKAILVHTDLVCQEVANSYYLDTQAKKKLKYLKWIKIGVTILIIVTATILLGKNI